MNLQKIKEKYAMDADQKIDEIVVYLNGRLIGSKPVMGTPGMKPREYVNEKEARKFANTFKKWDGVGYKNSVLSVFRPTYAELKKMK